MREILFKAKQTNNAQWVEGYFFKDGERNCYIQQGDTGLYYLVEPVTVCEFTGDILQSKTNKTLDICTLLCYNRYCKKHEQS